jgi:hypothetical protein
LKSIREKLIFLSKNPAVSVNIAGFKTGILKPFQDAGDKLPTPAFAERLTGIMEQASAGGEDFI